jgi:hypothetical protein
MTKSKEMLANLRDMRADMRQSQRGYTFVTTLGDVYKQIADLPIADEIITGTTAHTDKTVIPGVANVAKAIARMTETRGEINTLDGKSVFSYTGTPVDVEAAMFLTDLTAKVISDEVKQVNSVGNTSPTALRRLKVRTTSKELRKIVVDAIATHAAKSRSTSSSVAVKRTRLMQATA